MPNHTAVPCVLLHRGAGHGYDRPMHIKREGAVVYHSTGSSDEIDGSYSSRSMARCSGRVHGTCIRIVG